MDVIALTNSLYWLIGVFFVMACFTAFHESFYKGVFPVTTWQKTSGCIYAILAFVCPVIWASIVIVATLLLVDGGVSVAAAVVFAIVALALYVLALWLLKLVGMLLIFLLCLPFDLYKNIKRKMKNRQKSKGEA